MDYFLFFCKKIWISQDVLDEISSLQKANFSVSKENIWERWLWVFWKIVDVYDEESYEKYWIEKRGRYAKNVFYYRS